MRNILKNCKVHWVIKANFVADYWNTCDHTSVSSAVHDLKITENVFWEYIRLHRHVKEYPQLARIPTKTEAIFLMNQYTNKYQFRALVNVEATKYKSAKALNKVKEKMNESKNAEGSLDIREET